MDENKKKQAEEIRKILKLKDDYENNNLEKISEEIYQEHIKKIKEKGSMPEER